LVIRHLSATRALVCGDCENTALFKFDG